MEQKAKRITKEMAADMAKLASRMLNGICSYDDKYLLTPTPGAAIHVQQQRLAVLEGPAYGSKVWLNPARDSIRLAIDEYRARISPLIPDWQGHVAACQLANPLADDYLFHQK